MSRHWPINSVTPKPLAALDAGEFKQLQEFLDLQAQKFNRPDFITPDPISIPHQYSAKQDIEISGFFAAILAWGQRKTILNKVNELMLRMDNAPFDFISNHEDTDLKALLGFKHRTFNDTDLLYFVSFLKFHYQQRPSLEDAFIAGDLIDPDYLPSVGAGPELASAPCLMDSSEFTIERALNHFRAYFFSLVDHPARTKKHISSPLQGSTCKRLNMFLRWMVRSDNNKVDFGIWKQLKPSMLICPCDVHVDRVARSLGLISRKQTDWKTAVELTENLRMFDAQDPVKYDLALFGLGVG